MRGKGSLRINIVYGVFILLFVLLSVRIVYLQVIRRKPLESLAHSQYIKIIPLEGERGKIFDCRGRVLAANINVYSVYADPDDVKDKTYTAGELAQILHLDYNKILSTLRKKCHFVWVKRKASLYEKREIERLKMRGIYFLRDKLRFYPQGAIASHILGGVDVDNNGIKGVELFYNKFLRGKKGFVSVLRDALSHSIFSYPQIFEPKGGMNLYLTVDAQIQYWASEYLSDTVKEYSAKSGSLVVVNPYTGGIIALANQPDYDPNSIGNALPSSLRDRAAIDVFEPGSAFKIVTLVGALDRNIFSLDDKIYCENGVFKIPGSILHDWKPFGNLTFERVFEESSNIGVARIASKLGRDNLYYYIKRFGFGEKTGVDLPGEEKGLLKPLRLWSNTSGYIVPIGQEIGVTVLQLARAMCAIVNGGYLVKLHLYNMFQGSYGFVKKAVTQKVKIFSSSVSSTAKQVLIGVVNNGTGRRARIKGVTVGGKTGTAQKFDTKTGRYSRTKYRASFVGFVESRGKSFVICVSINEPHKYHGGGAVAAPLFRKVAQKLIDYENVSHKMPVNNDL